MDRRFPIGRFVKPEHVTAEDRVGWISDLEALPEQVRLELARIGEERLDVPYREGGWSARLVVHHLADSHMNSFVRFRLALTEEKPVIKPYDEAAWARLADSQALRMEPSLAILDGLHERWVAMLRSMGDADFARVFVHPEMGDVPLDVALALYSWHGRHHVAHLGLIGAA